MPDRAPPRRPDVVLFDVFETLLDLAPARERLTGLGRPAYEFDLFFARTLRDGMAHTLAGGAPPFAAVATEQLATTSGLDAEQARRVLGAFRELPAQPDAGPALRALDAAGVPTYAFTHGSAEIAGASLAGAGLDGHLRGVLSAESIGSFKPPPRVYHWACEQAGSPAAATALVAVHSWDTNGAVRAGLLAGLATRFEGRVPATVAEPHVTAERLDRVVDGLLAL